MMGLHNTLRLVCTLKAINKITLYNIIVELFRINLIQIKYHYKKMYLLQSWDVRQSFSHSLNRNAEDDKHFDAMNCIEMFNH